MLNTSFNHFLRTKQVAPEIRSLLYHIARAVKYVNFSLRAGNTDSSGSTNIQGEEQLALDVLADKIIQAELKKSELVTMAVSEEIDDPMIFDAPRGEFTVAYDPLDGSSLVNANLAIGSIFGIWEGNQLVGRKGSEQAAACYAVYGPRVTLTIAVKDKGVHEFEMNDVGEFLLTREDITIKEASKYFAPGNLKATNSDKKYKNLVLHWMSEGRTLRYSGGMVPDLHHILSKGHGIFAYPASPGYENGKLRLAFECAPFGFIFDEANGIALDQHGTKVVDKPVSDIHGRTTIFVGSTDDVVAAIKKMN